MFEPLLALLSILLPIGLVYVFLTLHPHAQKGKNGSGAKKAAVTCNAKRSNNLNEGNE